MSRILLADHSPHARRIGEFILREEGYDVVSVSDGGTALSRLAEVDPDVVLADVVMSGVSGYTFCGQIKSNPLFRHVRVVLTAGVMDPYDPEEAKRAGADGMLQRPFEATEMVRVVAPLAALAQRDREGFLTPAPAASGPGTVDRAAIRAAVAGVLGESNSDIIEAITERVMAAIGAGPRRS